MNWNAIGAIGEVISALGFVFTLAYLAVQIRQNTESVKVSTVQAMIEASAGFSDLCALTFADDSVDPSTSSLALRIRTPSTGS